MKAKTTRKICAAAMAVLMTVGTAALPASAEVKTALSLSATQSAAQKEMQEALTAVKKRVTIPERLTEFKYSTSTKYGTECFDFTWRDKEYKETVQISYANGLIISYNYNDNRNADNKEVKQSFAKLTDEKLIEAAKKHFKQLNSDIYGSVRFKVGSIDLFGNNATVLVDRVENGIAVEGNGGRITLNKDTGELVGMSIEWFWSGTEFCSASTRLSTDEAKAKYKELTTLTPIYRIVDEYNEKTGKSEQKAVLLYLPDFSEEIDAVTGKPSTIWDDMNNDKGSRTFSYYYINGFTAEGAEVASEDDCDEDAGVVFTEAELKEIEADKNMLKKDEITALLNKCKYTKMPDYVKLNNANLYKDEETEEYFYNISYSGGDDEDYDIEEVMDSEGNVVSYNSVTTAKNPYFYMYVNLNAKTGEVLSFNKSVNKTYDDTKAYPVKSNAKIAEAAAKYYYGDVFGEYKADESNSEPAAVYTDDEGKKHYCEFTRTYDFTRYVNGVKVEGDYIRICIDMNGEVLSISKNYSDVKFPSVPAFDKDKAFEQLFKQIKLNLYYDGYYKKDGTVKTYLLYDISSYILDSKYRVVSWDGTVLPAEKDDDTAYTDIKGIAEETAITTLARYGITLESENGKFNPNGKLTDKEFAAVVYKATRNYVPYYIASGNYKQEEAEKTLTRKEAAKVFVDIYGGADYAELKGIYRSPFTDVPTSDEYVGYIAIAKALGFASADSNGNYNPDKTVTRAQAMQLLYNYIKRLK
ncbi:MAG: S-layer homology domain-containing protein [Oscillospiraceae bacterium]